MNPIGSPKSHSINLVPFFKLALDHQTADKVGGDHLGGAGKEGLGNGWEELGVVVAMGLAGRGCAEDC